MSWNERIKAALHGEVDGASVNGLIAASHSLAELRQGVADRRLEAELAHAGEEWIAADDLALIATPLWLAEALVAMAQSLVEGEAEAHPDRPTMLSIHSHDDAQALLAPVGHLVAEISANLADRARPLAFQLPYALAVPRMGTRTNLPPGYLRGLLRGVERLEGAARQALTDMTTLAGRSATPGWLDSGLQGLRSEMVALGARLEMARIRIPALLNARIADVAAADQIAVELWDSANSFLRIGQLATAPALLPTAPRMAPPPLGYPNQPPPSGMDWQGQPPPSGFDWQGQPQPPALGWQDQPPPAIGWQEQPSPFPTTGWQNQPPAPGVAWQDQPPQPPAGAWPDRSSPPPFADDQFQSRQEQTQSWGAANPAPIPPPPPPDEPPRPLPAIGPTWQRPQPPADPPPNPSTASGAAPAAEARPLPAIGRPSGATTPPAAGTPTAPPRIGPTAGPKPTPPDHTEVRSLPQIGPAPTSAAPSARQAANHEPPRNTQPATPPANRAAPAVTPATEVPRPLPRIDQEPTRPAPARDAGHHIEPSARWSLSTSAARHALRAHGAEDTAERDLATFWQAKSWTVSPEDQAYLDQVAALLAAGAIALGGRSQTSPPFAPIYRAARAITLLGQSLPAGTRFSFDYRAGQLLRPSPQDGMPD